MAPTYLNTLITIIILSYTGRPAVMLRGGKVLLIFYIEHFTDKRHYFTYKINLNCIYAFSNNYMVKPGIES